MNTTDERRTENRLRYHWPIWFAEDFNDILLQGQLVDVSSGGAAFTCRSDGNNLYHGQQLTARFSVPKFSMDDSFNMTSFTRNGKVCRIDQVSNFIHRIALQFAKPLTFRPAEIPGKEHEPELMLKSLTI